MRSALDEIEQIRLDLLPGMRIANRGKSANYEWLDAIDVVNMLDACELIVHSSLERKESRGPFFRQDFPLTDNDNWLVANVLKKSGNGMRSSSGRTICRSSGRILSPRTILRSRGDLGPSHAVQVGMDARRLGQIETDDTLAARNARLAAGDTIAVRIRRSDGAGGQAACIRISRCRIRNGCGSSMFSIGSPRTKPPISPIDGSAAPRCAGPARSA